MTVTIIFINDGPELVFEPDTDVRVVERELYRIRRKTQKECQTKYSDGPYVHTHEVPVYEEPGDLTCPDETN